jgi:hypothetical protein
MEKEEGWWNYFELGLDFLIDETPEGGVRKVMVHSNIVRPFSISLILPFLSLGFSACPRLVEEVA